MTGGGSGGALGGGLGGILGTVLGVALAPETGGLSLAIPAALGAAGGFGGNALGDLFTGETFSPLQAGESAVGGAIGGGLAGAGGISGLANGIGGSSAAAASDPFGAAGGFTSDAGFGGAVGSDIVPGGANEVLSSAPAVEAPALAPGSDLAISGTAVPSPGGGVASFATPETSLASFGGGNPVAAAPAAGPAASAAGAPGSIDSIDTLLQTLGTSGADPFNGGLSADAGLAGAVGPGIVPGGGTPDLGGGFGPKDLLALLKGNKDLIGPGLLAGGYLKNLVAPQGIPGSGLLTANAGLASGIAAQNAGGNLTPAQQAQSDLLLKNQINAIKGKFANLGLSGSDAELAEIRDAQNKNLGTSASTETANQQTALTAIGAADAPTLAVAQQQIQDDNDLSKMLAALAAASISTGGKA